VVMEKGDLWSFGNGASGQLRLGTDANQLLPACVGGLTKCLVARLLSWWLLEANIQPA